MEPNDELALQNAWSTVIATADDLKAAMPDRTNLDSIQPKVLAQAVAAQALRGLVEELRRKQGVGE